MPQAAGSETQREIFSHKKVRYELNSTYFITVYISLFILLCNSISYQTNEKD